MLGTWGGHLQCLVLELTHRQDHWKREPYSWKYKKKHSHKTAQDERESLQHISTVPTGVCLPHMGPLFQKEYILQIEKIQSDFSTRSGVTGMLEKLGWRSLQTYVSACSTTSSMDL